MIILEQVKQCSYKLNKKYYFMNNPDLDGLFGMYDNIPNHPAKH